MMCSVVPGTVLEHDLVAIHRGLDSAAFQRGDIGRTAAIGNGLGNIGRAHAAIGQSEFRDLDEFGLAVRTHQFAEPFRIHFVERVVGCCESRERTIVFQLGSNAGKSDHRRRGAELGIGLNHRSQIGRLLFFFKTRVEDFLLLFAQFRRAGRNQRQQGCSKNDFRGVKHEFPFL